MIKTIAINATVDLEWLEIEQGKNNSGTEKNVRKLINALA